MGKIRLATIKTSSQVIQLAKTLYDAYKLKNNLNEYNNKIKTLEVELLASLIASK